MKIIVDRKDIYTNPKKVTVSNDGLEIDGTTVKASLTDTEVDEFLLNIEADRNVYVYTE